MCPTPVSTKLPHRPSGGSSSIAGFSSSEKPLETCEAIFPKMVSDDHEGIQKYKVFVSTWNVGGVVPEDDLVLEEWLDTENTYDIYVLGFQETVPLSARNVLGPERRRPSSRWNSLIRSALNRSSSYDPKEFSSKVGERQKVHPVKDGSPREFAAARDFRCVASKQMVGIFVSVWVRGDLRRHIRYPGVSCVGCGIMGFLGNKGSVSVRFQLHGTSFCFVCCHLASGGKAGDEVHRNSDAVEIFSRTSFAQGPSIDLPRNILDHDRVILLGDLNYRISLSDARTRSLVEIKEWSTLLESDQLRVEVSRGGVFDGWTEGNINFSPTYKYHPNSDEYYGCDQGRKGEKRRVPAWCDRILWRGDGLKQIRYDRCECRLSDHRPVRAIFIAEVEVSEDLNSLESFFL
uniref:Type I inositol 1,4,5-trisphosphate 5-phosphatase CVP2 n=1 Tax=Anthurium amnicola TaxID=1678845 RepID=A0A1D1Z9Z3_9ARAE